MYKIIFSPTAEKIYEKVYKKDKTVFFRIRNGIESLKNNPMEGKPLKDRLYGKRSLRIGSYRVIYSVEEKILKVFILDIGHRRDIYR